MPTNKKSNGFLTRVGSLFGKKPERHVTPHIYVSTESEVKKRRAKAKQRAAKEKAAREAAAAPAPESVEAVETEEAVEAEARVDDGAPVAGEGTLRSVEPAKDEPASAIDEAALADEDGFMKKVKLQKTDRAPRKGLDVWTLLRDRFSFERPAKKAAPVAQPIAPEKDSFLQRATAVAPDERKIRVESSEPAPTETPSAESSAPSALDEAASGDVAAKQNVRRSSESEGGKAEVAKAMDDNKDILDARKKAEPAPAPAPKSVKKKIHMAQFQGQKGFKAFLTSLNYIGMGKERMLFIQNMATMLNAGLPLTDSLKTLVLETRNRPMRKLIQRIIDMVENGSPLWRAMEAQNFFSLHALALVRIGEEAGNLSENMQYLAEQDEKDHALKSKVKMAMIYPTIVMVIMFVIVVGLGMFVLPNLVGVLFSLNVELPLITRIVIWFSDAFTQHGAVGIPSFIAGFVVLAILSKYTALRYVTQWIMFRIPGIGKLAREATIARFGVILGGLLKAGVPVVEALESLVQVTPIAAYKRLYAQMLAQVTIGDSFSKCFATIKGSRKLLPASVQQLVITGEKSGSLADIVLKIADIYDKKASETAEKLPIILEPMLLLFIGGLVGSIAFAIIIPIYSIVGNVGG